MIRIEGGNAKIEITETELIQSIGLLKDLRDYCNELQEEREAGRDVAGALQVTIDAMVFYMCEHFE